MSNNYDCLSITKMFRTTCLFLILGFSFFSYSQIGTQKTSIRSGVTFQWEDIQDTNNNGTIDGNEDNSAATIRSIMVNGTTYNTFVVPTSYELTRLGPGGHSINAIRENNNTVISGSNSAGGGPNSSWNSAALAAFQDKNLNHYYTSNGNGEDICLDFDEANGTDGEDETEAQMQTLFFDPAIPSNTGGIIAITERGGNNCFYIRLFGIPAGGGPEQPLGDTFVRNQGDLRGSNVVPPTSNSDYWQSGRKIDNGQAIAIALFNLNDVAPTGSKITRVRFISATEDDGDGKFFILQRYAAPQVDLGCVDGTINGQIDNSTSAPVGSTYSLVSPPSPAGQSFNLNSDGSFTYVPNPGFTGQVVFEYRVTLPAPNDSISDTNTVTLTYNDNPDAPTIDVSCNPNGSSYDVEITSPLGSQYKYNVNGGPFQSSTSFNNLSGGSYTFGITDVLTECTVDPSPTIINLDPINASISSISEVDCFGESTGSIDIDVTGGIPPYTFTWSNVNDSGFSANSEDISNIPAGNYNVVISDSSGCTFQFTSSVIVPGPSNALYSNNSVTDVACFGESTGAISITAAGGTAPYSYSLDGGAAQNNGNFNNLSAGNYSVTITDSNNCTLNVQLNVEQPNAALSQTNSVTDITCFGESTGAISVTAAGGTAPYSYSLDGGSAQNNGNFNNLSAGNYSVTITDSNNCTLDVQLTVEQPNAGLSQANSVTDVACFGESTGAISISAAGGTSPYSYSLDGGSAQNNGNFNNLSAGNYLVTITDSNNCTLNVQLTVEQPNAGLSQTNSVTDVACFGESTGAIFITASGGTAPYSYSLDGGSAQNNGNFNNLSAGNYSVTISDSNNCSLNVQLTIGQPNAGLSQTNSVTDVACFGESTGAISVTAAGGTAPYSYSLDGGSAQNNGNFNNLLAGNYSVTITDSNNCTLNVQLSIDQPDNGLSLTTSKVNVLCNGDSTGSIDLTVTGGTSPYSYSWSNGESSEDLSSLPSGAYNVTVTDSNGCTTSLASPVLITQPEPISIELTKTNANATSGCSNGSATATPSGGVGPYTFLWSDGQTTATASGLSGNPIGGTTYSVTVTDANGCTNTQSIVINCVQDCDATISIGNVVNVLCKDDETGMATVTASSASNPNASFTFIWSPAVSALNQNDTNTTSTISGLSAGVYTVSITIDGTVCLPVEESITITEPSTMLNVSATSTDETGPTTNDGTATANPSGGTPPYTYLWNTGDTTQTISGLSDGNYSVTVTDNNGCTANTAVTVNDGDCRNLSAVASATPVTCNAGNDGTATVNVTGGIGPFTYSWDNGQTTQSISGLTAGTYTVTVFDSATGCNSESTATVDEPSALSSGIAVTNVACFGENTGSLDLTVTGGTAPYSFNWSNGETTEDITNLSQGNYSVTITDANGCVLTDNATVSQPNQPLSANVTSQTDIVCDNSGSVTVSAQGGTPPYLYNLDGGANQSNGTFSPILAGSYTINITDANLCTTAISVTILENCIAAINDINDTYINLPVSGDLSTNDLNPDGPAGSETFTVIPNSGPNNGTLVFNTDGTYTYTPNTDFVGEDTFTYEVCDAGNPIACDTATVTIEVLPVPTSGNEPPVANDDTNTTEVDTPVNGNVIVNDFDPDGDTIVVTANTDPANGTLVINPDGTYTYTPNTGFTGEDTFDYTICDDANPQLCDTATVTIQIVDNNGNLVVANDDAYNGPANTDINGNVTSNDNDPEGDDFSVISNTNPTNGNVTVNPDGTFTYTPNADFTGTDQFTYTIEDANGATDTATVYITVANPGNQIDAINDINDTYINLPVSGDVSTNDLNPDGPAGSETFTVIPNSGPNNGTLVFNPDGTYTYTPNADFVGEDTFSYEVCDAGNPIACDTATVTIEVLPVPTSGNEPPVANDDTNTTEVDTPVNGNVIVNDFDPDGDTIVVTANTDPANGTLVINPDGTYTYTPNTGFTGEDTFDYTICDDANPQLCDTATVTIQIVDNNGNLVVANDDAYNGPANTDINGNVTTNDNDPEGDDFSVISNTNPTNGNVTVNPDGTFTYTPNADFTGTDQFTYTIEDANGATDTATVYITVANPGNQIDAINDINDTYINLPVSGDVSTNDLNPDGPAGSETFTVIPNSGPNNGTLVFNPDGTYTYTPNTDFVGEDTFSYEVCDAGNPIACDTATVTIEVLPVPTSGNEPPVANDDTNTTEVDTPVNGNVIVNDFDPDGDTIVVTANTDPANGTLVINPDGTYTYTPNTGFTGEDTFDYTICDDANPQLCDTATVTIQIVDNNGNLVVANDDAYNGPANTDINGNVTSNDNDPEGDDFSVISNTNPTNGNVTVNPDGTFTYTPNADFTGTDQFTYTIEDANGATDTATVYITVANPGNQIDAINDINDTYINLPVSGDVSTNDLNPDGPAGSETFTVIPNSGPNNGTLVFNPDGTYTYTPNADFVGEDTFSYEVCDAGNPIACDTATVTIEVLPVPTSGNEPPVANDDTNTTEVDTPVNGNVIVNDFDPDGDTIVVTANTDPANGTLVINPDGTYTYTPNTGFTGEDTFDYTICDDANPQLCDTATVTIQIVDNNGNLVVANDDAYNGPANTDINGNVTTNDNDPEGDDFSVISNTNPTNGNVTVNPDGTFTYTPNADFTGTDQFTYTIEDANGATDTATVYITVANPGNQIDAINDINDTYINLPVSGDVSTNDLNPDGPAGSETFTVIPNSGPNNGTLVFNTDGTYTYTPNTDFVGEDTFTYEVCDAGNPIACDTATVTIEVLPVPTSGNEPPVANDDTNTTEVDTPVNGNVIVNDFDPDGDTIVVTANTDPANGTLVINPDGTYTYTPNTGFTGEDTFDYTICDDANPQLCDTATVTIQIVDNNGNLVVANDDAYNGPANTDINGNVTSNDNDPEGDDFSVISNTNPTNGNVTVNPDGTFTYTPNADFTGTDQFTYTIEDANGATDTATVYITVANPGNQIDAINDINDTYINLPVSGDVSTNDLNPDGPAGSETFTVIPNSGPNNGTLVFNPDGTYTYTPNADFVGEDTFSYEVCDAGNPIACDTATVTIEVLPVPTSGNEPPVANDDTNTTEVDTPVNGNVIVNDFDPDGDTIIVTANTDPANGTLVINPDGTYTYTPNPGFTGEDTFDYTICDDANPQACDTATVTIQIVDNNGNLVVANDDAYNGPANTDINGNVTTNDNDPEGDDFSVISNTNPTNGNVTVNPDGTFTYTPNADFTGTDQFTYTIEDANGATDTATVYITVANPGNQIDAINDTYINLPVSGDVSTNDLNPDGPAGSETFTVIPNSGPNNGTLVFNTDGTYTYTPNTDFVGEDTFTYEVCDAGNPIACDTATVTIEVLPVPTSGNEPPVANDDTNTTEVDTPVNGNVIVNDFDPDGDTIVVTANTDPANGTLVINPDGTYTYTPNTGFTGEDTFDYTICDDANPQLCDTATVTIQIVDNNGNLVVANDDAYNGPANTDINGNVTSNDNDPEGDDFSVISNTNPTNGNVTVNPDGTFTYTPNADFTGTDQFTYTIEDANGATDTATVYITVATIPSVQIALVKTGVFIDGNQNQCSDVGEEIIYTFTVTNQGNEALSNITLSDPLFEAPNPIVSISFDSGDTNNDGILDITEIWTYSATYSVTQSDIDAGNVTNQATVTGNSFGVIASDTSDDNSVLENDPTVTTLCNNASIDLVKIGVFNNENQDQCSDIGETITYTITVTNTGNTSLNNVVVTDSLLDNATPAIPLQFVSGDLDNDNELDPNETWTYTADYPITQADINALEVDNTAIVNATDVANGTNVTDMQEVTTDLIEDQTPPDPSQCEPLDATVECDSGNNQSLADAWNSANITTLENCVIENCTSFTVTSNYNFDNLLEGCGNTGTLDVVYTLTDIAGNISAVNATFTIIDNSAPVFETLPDVTTINCPEDPQFAQAIATDACSNNVELTFVDVETPGNCIGEYSITITWTATDECGNSSQASQTINVIDVDAPVFQPLPDEITVECPENPMGLFQSATATDACSGVTLSFTDNQVDGDCPGTYSLTRTWTATDSCGNSAQTTQTINVVDTVAPVITVPSDITVECTEDTSTAALGNATATDSCSDNINLTFVDTTTPGNCSGQYTITRTWTATDECGNSSTASQSINVEDNSAPVFDTLPAESTINCPNVPEFVQATATDACNSGVTLTFEDVTTQGDCAGEYSVTRTWTATDDCGNSSQAMQTINVVDNEAPIFEALPAESTINCPSTPEFTQAVVTDTCDSGVTLSFEDVTTQGNCAGEYSVTRTWTAIDDCGNASTATQIINVIDNDAPIFDALPAETTINCPATPEFTQANATDACDSNVTLTFEDETTQGDCEGEYTVTRTWTATDNCGNSSQAMQTINVIDETAPEISVPADVTIECTDDATPDTLGSATAIDACSSNVEISFEDITTPGNCDGEFTITRTWTATDECGNTSNAVQTINVEDNTAPELIIPDDVTVECTDDSSTAATGEATATDLCSNNVTISSSDVTEPGNCPNTFTISRTWTATDDCGNTSTEVQIISVVDTTAPVVITAIGELDATVECSDAGSLNNALSLVPSATDNCSNDITITLVDDITTPDADCSGAFVRTRTWTFDDGCGNISEPFTQTITVVDTTAPVLITTDFDAIVSVECGEIPEIPVLEFEDNCSVDVLVDYSEEINEFPNTNDYEIVRNWTVDDGCGNVTVVRQVITVSNPVLEPVDGNRCIDDGVIDLFDFLQPGVDTSGTWSIVIGNNISLNNNLFDPQNGGVVGEIYTFRYQFGDACPITAEVNITLNGDCIVLPCGAEDVNISNTITSNGDGVNEFFEITGVETCGFVYEVEIYNRWGAVVYKNNNYQNDWSGQTVNNSVGNSNNVPTGTYYYVVTLRNSGLEPFAGPIYIVTGN